MILPRTQQVQWLSLVALVIGATASPPRSGAADHLDLMLTLETDRIVLTWSGGLPPYRVWTASDLETWTAAGTTAGTEMVFPIAELESRVFFQVEPEALPLPDPEARYRVTFTSTWSRDIFAAVPDLDHFSGLIGLTHDGMASLWQPGETASDGIEQMAETGRKTILTTEINALISDGSGGGLLSGSGLGVAGSQTALEFPASLEHPLVSLVSMIAPSPDWFVGVHDLSLLGDDGDWIDSVAIDLLPYDSGTDDGIDFQSPNADTNPAEPVTRIDDTVPFAVQAGAPPPPNPVATFVFERLP